MYAVLSLGDQTRCQEIFYKPWTKYFNTFSLSRYLEYWICTWRQFCLFQNSFCKMSEHFIFELLWHGHLWIQNLMKKWTAIDHYSSSTFPLEWDKGYRRQKNLQYREEILKCFHMHFLIDLHINPVWRDNIRRSFK